MEVGPNTIMGRQTAGWNIIEILTDYLTAVDMARFDTTHNAASKIRGITRKFIITGLWI